MTTTNVFTDLERLLARETGAGAVLASGGDTLVKGPLYVMALNPGGSANDEPGSVLDSIHKLRSLEPFNDWTASGYGKRGRFTPFQLRIQTVFEALEADSVQTLCTNSLFLKERRASGLEKPWQNWWDTYWPVHQRMLAEVQPKVIVCLGNGSALSSWELLRLTRPRPPGKWTYDSNWEQLPTPEPSADGKWRDVVNLDLGEFGKHSCSVLGLPHPSGQVVNGWPLNQEAMRKIGLPRKATGFSK